MLITKLENKVILLLDKFKEVGTRALEHLHT